MSLNCIRPVSYPNGVYKFTYNDQHLFYATSQEKVVRVNQHGSTVLQLAKKYPSVEEIIRKCAEKLDLPAEKIRLPTIAFLEKMIKEGFLSCDTNSGDENGRLYNVQKKDVNLKALYLHLTNKCNHQCRYCYNQTFRSSSDRKAPLSLTEYESILSEFYSLGGESVIFTGGEPLLSPHLITLATYAKKVGLKTSLLTNGTLCTVGNAPEICKSFDLIIVSLDSKYAEEHDSLRGKGTHARTIAGIRSLSSYLNKNSLLESQLYCRPVITKNNLRNIIEYPRFVVEELGCSKAFPNAYVPTKLSDFENNLFIPFMDIFPYLIEFQSELEKLGGTIGKDIIALKSFAQCAACSTRISVTPDGSIFPCQSLHHPDLVVGNIRDGRLDQVVKKSPIAAYFRNFHYSQIETCKDCTLGNLCGGGCRAMAYDFYKDLSAYNEVFCQHFRHELEFGLWMKSLNTESRISDPDAPGFVSKCSTLNN